MLAQVTRTTILALAGALLAAACSGSSEPDVLVVADATGVVAVDENGEEQQRLGTVDVGTFAFQPTWSHDGRYVAYSEASDTAAGDLVIAGVDGSETRLERTTRPYYFSWDPGGARVVTLRNLEIGDGILVESVGVDGTTEEIDRGAPYYFAWAPDGGRYLLHVEQTRIEEFVPGSGTESLGTAGAFQAPSWDEAGRVYIRADGGRQTLVLEDEAGPQDLASVGGHSQFTAAAGRVAIQTFATGDGVSDGQSAALQQLPSIEPGAVYVVDADGAERILDEAALAFFWSPDATSLLILSSDASGPGNVRWHVWDGAAVTDYEVYGVEPSWVASFLPFFDQYATSVSLWKPDGTAFAFPGVVDGERGVWLQRLIDDRPTKIADGYWAAWRPQP